jgi:hypothetical protein
MGEKKIKKKVRGMKEYSEKSSILDIDNTSSFSAKD